MKFIRTWLCWGYRVAPGLRVGQILYGLHVPLLGVVGPQQQTLWPAFCYILSHKSGGGDPQSSADGNTHVKVRLSGAEDVAVINVRAWAGRARCPESSRMSCLTLWIT